MSEKQDQVYFADGLSEEILNLLAQSSGMRVIARTSSFSFKSRQDLDVEAIASKLEATHVLEGSVRKSGDRIRITAQLVDGATSGHLWSQTYDREATDIFVVQDEIAAAVAASLNAEEISRVIAEAAAEAAAQTSPRSESAIRYLDIALGLPIPLPETLGMVRTLAKGAVGYWRKVTDQFSYRQTLFKDAYKSEVGTTLVLFKDFRSETRRFIDEYNYEKAQKECDAGEAALEQLVAASPAPGQKEDLRLFVNEARLRLRERFNQGKWTWDDFVRKHGKKFFGPVVPHIKDELLSTSAWHERKRNLHHMNLHAMLKAWRDDNRHLKLVEIANAGSEVKQLVGYIVDEMVALKSALDATMSAVIELERLNEAREQDARSLE